MGPASCKSPRRASLLWLALTVGCALLRRPGLWGEALRQVRPAASAPYREFRSVTAYGEAQQLPTRRDVVAWLAWARSQRRLALRPGASGRARRG